MFTAPPIVYFFLLPKPLGNIPLTLPLVPDPLTPPRPSSTIADGPWVGYGNWISRLTSSFAYNGGCVSWIG